MVTWTLTERQAEKIRLMLWAHDDEGPGDESWPSEQLEEVRAAVGYPLTWGGQGREAVNFDDLR